MNLYFDTETGDKFYAETTDELYEKAVDAMKNYSKSEMPYNVVTFDVAPISKEE